MAGPGIEPGTQERYHWATQGDIHNPYSPQYYNIFQNLISSYNIHRILNLTYLIPLSS